MRKLVLLLLACAVLGAQDLPPAAVAPVVPAAPPVLAIANPNGGTCTLSWSGGVLTNMVLQQSSSLTGPWVNVGITPALVATQYQVVVTPTGSPKFFRLSSP